ncbi:DNA primase small subunit PriS [Acidianus sulfidivorans JP7]|uniref:DNA primase small subunit PriS n=1 Tax=Acidianus sulfidivorans JP7 TaxID=619593 RepID=A0A2U9INN4_9CREN|nr:DNA primase small subunit PriS [Acidianus sulfidivorans]AWR97668.1 DNA primase small subunit PriS [Acidianus sulfidivorans JP7]
MGIFTLLPELNKILLMLFKDYYEKATLQLPSDMELREFAYQPLNKSTYVRHLSFNSEIELKEFLRNNVPLHLFYSSARYQIPSAKEMEEKGWMGADLQFDIDADEICQTEKFNFCPVCGSKVDGEKCPRDNVDTIEYQEITQECIDKAYQNTLIIYDILKEDFGFNPSIYFSGNRGFHVYVVCYGECALMSSSDRKKIIDYIQGVGLPKYENTSIEDPGWPGRVARGITKTILDEQVTIDVKRLVRIPYSLHGKSGLIVKEVSTEKFEFSKDLSPFNGSVIFLPYISGEFKIIDEKVRFDKGIPIKLDASIGIYAFLKGLGEVKLYVR